MKRNILMTGLSALLLISCEPEVIGPIRLENSSSSSQGLVEFSIGGSDMYSTKTSYGDNIEKQFSGAVIGAYNAETGQLDSEISIPASGLEGKVSMRLPVGKYNFYLLGNLWLVNKSNGSTESLKFPAVESELADYYYRMDGGDAANGFRRERFSDMSRLGIPLYWVGKGVSVRGSSSVDIVMHRLFSKLIVSIDHSGISGTRLSDFVNESVHIRQANCRIVPFASGGSKALSAEDVVMEGDYEAEMENGLVREYVFYVPENKQGVLMPKNSDPDRKDEQGVEEACGNNGISRRLSYLEFSGAFDGGAGLDGSVLYRFYLGKNSTSDFDVVRNTSLRVALRFKLNSIFKPDWKVDSEDLRDNRQFYLSGSLAGRLPDGKVVAVRKNRPGTVLLNLALSEGGSNIISSAHLVDKDYTPSSVDDYAWTSDCWSLSHKLAYEPKRQLLAELGISVEQSGEQISFKVTNPSLFRSGQEVPVSFILFPGGRECTAVIRTYDDISVTESKGRDLSTDFYVAEKRVLSFSGFAGSKIYYYSDQNECGATYGGLHTFNRQWKTSPTLSAPFPTCKLDANGNILHPYQAPSSYSSQRISSSDRLEVCAFYPNAFLTMHFYRHDYGSLMICSDDILNDDLISMPLKIKEPYLKWSESFKKVVLPIDGTEYSVGPPYMNINKTENLDIGRFDPDLYKLLLKPMVIRGSSVPWTACVTFDENDFTLYVGSFECTAGNLVEMALERSNKGECSLGTIIFSGNPQTGLYPTSYNNLILRLSIPYLPSATCDFDLNHFNIETFDSEFDLMRVRFVNGDPANCSMSREGPEVTYRCYNYPYPVVFPVYDSQVDGWNYKYVYSEKKQLETASNGEKVPGGLLVPYGEQKMKFNVVNKWCGSQMTVEADFNVSYHLTFMQFGVFAPERMATVYFAPMKNFKYIEKIGREVTYASRRWMLQVLNTDLWKYHIASSNCYLNSYTGVYYSKPISYACPRTDFDVKYVNSSAAVWTESLARKAYEDNSYLWLNTLKVVNDQHVPQDVPNKDPALIGSPWLSAFFCTSKSGYMWFDFPGVF